MSLASVFPAIGECVPAIRKACHHYGITTLNEQAAFIAQTGHESAGFARFSENLNYSAKGLIATWPNRFPRGIAQEYANKPQAIANRAYADRYGNGNEASGDGWRYRGRGAIQITFKANYEAFAKAFGISLDEAVVYLGTVEGAFMSAGWFWTTHKLNVPANAGNMLAVTKAINGGTNGLQQRCDYFTRVRSVLAKDGLL